MLRIFGNSRNSPTIPLDCRCFRFFLPSHLASSVRRFRSVPSSLDACFWNFDNSRSLCRTVRAVVQHSLPKIVTHARSHCRQFFFIFIQFLVDRQEISRFPPTIFEISHSLALSFANSGRSSFIFSFFRSYPRSFRIRKLSTLHCDVLWMFTLKKRKKEILRQFQIAILPKKNSRFCPVNTSLLPDTSRSLASHPRNSKLLHGQFHYRTVQSPKGSFFSLLTGLTRLLVSIMIEPRLPQIRAIVHRRSDAIPGTLVQAENV